MTNTNSISSPRPLIGITRDSATPKNSADTSYAFYATSIEKAGGIPFPICYTSDLSTIPHTLNQIAGLLFSGGDDLDPSLYNQPWHPNAKPINPIRQQFELALLSEAERRQLPILGICLGVQLMNVHRGGTLIQFLPDHTRSNPLEHRKLDAQMRRHNVSISPHSLLAKTIGQTNISVNTYHKQAVLLPGRSLQPTAFAPDGIIEALEDPSLPLFLGVQWHPERITNEPEHLALFQLLIEKSLVTGH